MLSLNHVTKSYGATRAVDDVSLTIRQGEIVGLIGENGAGKTTLMRIVANEIAPDAGTITAPATGMVHQHFALVSHFTIAENLALVRDRRFRFVSRTALEREATILRHEKTDRETLGDLFSELGLRLRGELQLPEK